MWIRRNSVRMTRLGRCQVEDGIVRHELVMRFTRKGVWDHARGLLARWRAFSFTAIAIFGVLWTGIEAPAYLLKADLRDARFYIGAIFVSLVGAAIWTARSYVHDCPAGFEHESLSARRIAQLQRERWEHRLANELLQDVLRDLDDELAALSEGRVFVHIERQLDPPEYIQWVGLGPNNVQRMVAVAKKLLIHDLPTALGSEDEGRKPLAIRAVVYRIRDLYRETVAFERSRRAVEPPAGAEHLHELQLGWTEPVRDGVRQMFDFFAKVLSLGSLDEQQVAFTVTMDEPPNLQAFNLELDRIESTGEWQSWGSS